MKLTSLFTVRNFVAAGLVSLSMTLGACSHLGMGKKDCTECSEGKHECKHDCKHEAKHEGKHECKDSKCALDSGCKDCAAKHTEEKAKADAEAAAKKTKKKK